MPSILQRIASSRRLRTCRSLGIPAFFHFEIQSWRLSAADRVKPLPLRSKHSAYPLLCRPHTTDILVFDQIFIEREYQFLNTIKDPQLILDCGANVGYSTAYFLSLFPRAQVLAVEPDPSNFSLLLRNLAPFGMRAKALHTAIWSHRAKLTIQESPYRDGAAWSRQVRECRPSESGFDAVDIGELLAISGRSRISLLKMDIEGAEAVVFGKNTSPWLDKVDNIAIELHSDSHFGNAPEIFFAAIKNQNFRVTTFGELTLCMRAS